MSWRDLRAEQNYELALLWERARAIADATGEPIQTPAHARARAKTRQAKRDVAIGLRPPPPVPVACSFPPEPPHALSIPLPSLPLPTFVPRPATELPQPLPKSQSAPAIKPTPPPAKEVAEPNNGTGPAGSATFLEKRRKRSQSKAELDVVAPCAKKNPAWRHMNSFNVVSCNEDREVASDIEFYCKLCKSDTYHLRKHSGCRKEFQEGVMGCSYFEQCILPRAKQFVVKNLYGPTKKVLTICCRCPHGRHRSVACAELLGRAISSSYQGVEVTVCHLSLKRPCGCNACNMPVDTPVLGVLWSTTPV